MNSELISYALNCLEDRHISDTEVFSPETICSPMERSSNMRAKRIMTIALAAALILALGITAYALGVHSGFLHNAFGTGVPGQEAKTVELLDPEGNVVTVESYPSQERVDMDEEKAEALVGAYISAVGQSAQLGDFTFTVREVMIDENGNGAVTVDVDNPKGHGRKPDGSFSGDGQPDTWFGYSVWSGNDVMVASRDYAVTEGYSDTHISFVYSISPDSSAPLGDIILRFGLYSMDKDREEADIVIPAAERIPAKDFYTEGLTASISPVGMTLCFDDAYNDGEYEEYVLNELLIHYSDGSTYVVQGENTVNYMCATLDRENKGIVYITFNRLADIETVSGISVKADHNSDHGRNEVYYSAS